MNCINVESAQVDVVYGHWYACFLSFIALVQAGSFYEEDLYDLDKPNWMQKWYLFQTSLGEDYIIDIVGYDWSSSMNRYIISLYWALTTTTSIGYGDITPITPVEIWIVTIMMLVSGFIWALFLGKAIEIIEKISADSKDYTTKLSQMNRLIRHFNVDESQISSVLFAEKAYYSFRTSVATHGRLYINRQYKSIIGVEPETELRSVSPVMDTLPITLRNNICLCMIHKYLVRVKQFTHASVRLVELFAHVA